MKEDPAPPQPTTAAEKLAESLACRAQGDEELRVFVYGDLLRRARTASQAELKEALDRLGQNEPETAAKIPHWWQRPAMQWNWLALMLLCLLSAAAEAPGIVLSAAPLGVLKPALQEAVKDWGASRQTPQSVLNFRPHTEEDEVGIYRSLWEKQPQDAGLYYVYCRISQLHHLHALPPDFDETWRRIDPHNAIWPLMKAQTLGLGAMSFMDRSGTSVADPVAFEQALADIREAVTLPGIDAYELVQPALIHRSFMPPQNFAEAEYIQSYDTSFRRGMYVVAQELKTGALLLQNQLHALPTGSPEWTVKQQELRDFLILARRGVLLSATGSRHRLWTEEECRVLGGIASTEGFLDEEAHFNELKEALIRRFPAQAPATSGTEHWRSFWPAPGYKQASYLPAIRVALLALAFLFLIVAGVMILTRAISRKSAASQMALCLWPLRKPEGGQTIFALSLFPAAAALFAVPLLDRMPDMAMVVVLAVLTTLAGMAQAARREVAARMGFLGIGCSRRGRLIGRVLWIIAAGGTLTVAIYSWNRAPWGGVGFLAIVGNVGLWVCGIVLLALSGGFLRGFMHHDKAVSHRFIARRVIPGILLCSLWLCLEALALRPIERLAVGRAGPELWTPPESEFLEPETRSGLEELWERWKG